MIDAIRLVSAAAIAVLLLVPGPPVRAQSLGQVVGQVAGQVAGSPAVAAQDLWDSVRAGTFGALEYGTGMMRALTGWVTGAAPGPDEIKAEDIRGLLNLSDKEFRDFETLVRSAGYVLQGYSFGLDGGSEVELGFEFERLISDRERADLRRLLDQQNGAVTAVRRSIVLGLLDATRYVDSSPASGFRLAGVAMRLGSPADVRIRFRRIKP